MLIGTELEPYLKDLGIQPCHHSHPEHLLMASAETLEAYHPLRNKLEMIGLRL